jgi:hypothetical protein
MLIGYFVWLLNHKARQKAFSKIPFNEIERIGFYKSYIGDSSKWSFTDEIKEGKLNGFTLRMDVSKDKNQTIQFDTPTEWRKLDKSEYGRLTDKFNQHSVKFRIGGLVRHYDTKRPILQTVSDLKQDLELFTTLLRQEGFEPKS